MKFRNDAQRKAVFANMFKDPDKKSAVRRFGQTKNLNVEKKKGKNIVKSKRTTKNVNRIEGGLKNYSKAVGINIGLGVLFEPGAYVMSDSDFGSSLPSTLSANMPPHGRGDESIIEFKSPIPIELTSTSDEYTNLKPGAKGKATGWNKAPDDTWILMVNWENGSNLGLVYREDKWKSSSSIKNSESITVSRKVRRTGRIPGRRKYIFEDLKTDVSPISGRKLEKAGPLEIRKKIKATKTKISRTSAKISKVKRELKDVRHELRVAKTKRQIEKARKKAAKIKRELKQIEALQREKENLAEEERKLKKMKATVSRPKLRLPGFRRRFRA